MAPGRKKTRLVLLCVVGRVRDLLGVLDLLDAAATYLTSATLVLVDNTGSDIAWRFLRGLARWQRQLVVLRNTEFRPPLDGVKEEVRGRRDAQWFQYVRGTVTWSLLKGMRYAVEHLDFDALLKLDPDSLIVGPGLDGDICDYLEAHPEVGQLGSYKLDCNGKSRAREFECFPEEFARDRLSWNEVLRPLQTTRADFMPGEHAQGGGVAYSRPLVEALLAGRPFPPERLRDSLIFEDIVFSTLCLHLGFEIHGFADPGQPLAVGARAGLPMSIRRTRRARKKLVHPLKVSPSGLARRAGFAAWRLADRLR